MSNEFFFLYTQMMTSLENIREALRSIRAQLLRAIIHHSDYRYGITALVGISHCYWMPSSHPSAIIFRNMGAEMLSPSAMQAWAFIRRGGKNA